MKTKKLLTSLAKQQEFEQVFGDVIPGPPPEFVPNLILNVHVSANFEKADDKLEVCRGLTEKVLRLTRQSLPPDFFGSISVRLFTQSSGIRDYCANLGAEVLRQANWSSVFWNETSQDDAISAQIDRPADT